jgi:hypothetical protein
VDLRSLGLSAVVAIAVGARRHHPARPLAWYLLAAGVLSFITGDLIYKVSNEILHIEPPFPSVADLFYLAMYPFLAAGLLQLVRARRVDPAARDLVRRRPGGPRMDRLLFLLGRGRAPPIHAEPLGARPCQYGADDPGSLHAAGRSFPHGTGGFAAPGTAAAAD